MDEQSRASLMQEAIAAAQSGDRATAYRSFRRVVDEGGDTETALIWLSATSDDPDEALAAARRALAINPNNPFAQEAESYALQVPTAARRTPPPLVSEPVVVTESASFTPSSEPPMVNQPVSTTFTAEDDDLIPDWLQNINRPTTQPQPLPPDDDNVPLVVADLPVSESRPGRPDERGAISGATFDEAIFGGTASVAGDGGTTGEAATRRGAISEATFDDGGTTGEAATRRGAISEATFDDGGTTGEAATRRGAISGATFDDGGTTGEAASNGQPADGITLYGRPIEEAADTLADADTIATPIASRPARDNRLEQRVTMAEQRRISRQTAQRNRNVVSALVLLVGLGVVGLLGWWFVGLAQSNQNNVQSGFNTPTLVPSTATVLPATAAPVVVDATGTALAVAPTIAAQGTATAIFAATTVAETTVLADTFPTATAAPAEVALNSGISSYDAGNYQQAISLLEQAVAQDRNQPLAHYYLGLSYLVLAQQPLSDSLGVEDTPAITATAVLTNTGTVTASGTTTAIAASPTAASAGDSVLDPTTAYDRAGNAFRNVISLAPDWAAGHARLADTLLRQRRYAEAVDPARRATELDPGRPEHWLLLAQAYEGTGESAQADAANVEAERLSPPEPGATPRVLLTVPRPTVAPTTAAANTATPAKAASPAANMTVMINVVTATPATSPTNAGNLTSTPLDLAAPSPTVAYDPSDPYAVPPDAIFQVTITVEATPNPTPIP